MLVTADAVASRGEKHGETHQCPADRVVAQREDGAADVPDRINKAAAAKVGASLVVRKLMREIRARRRRLFASDDFKLSNNENNYQYKLEKSNILFLHC